MENKIAHLVKLQYQLNYLIKPDWIEKALDETYDYRTAASQEISEALESFGYAWWTERPVDMQNVFTELVDAMHFILSQSIAQVDSVSASVEAVAEVLGTRISERYRNVDQEPTQDTVKIRKLFRQLQASANTGTIAEMWDALFSVTKALDFGADHIYARYVAKSILNTFRQENGYKTGQYQKIWLDGQEDNTHVATYIDSIAADQEFDANSFLSWLTSTYSKVKNSCVLEQTAKVNSSENISPVAKNSVVGLANKRK